MNWSASSVQVLSGPGFPDLPPQCTKVSPRCRGCYQGRAAACSGQCDNGAAPFGGPGGTRWSGSGLVESQMCHESRISPADFGWVRQWHNFGGVDVSGNLGGGKFLKVRLFHEISWCKTIKLAAKKGEHRARPLFDLPRHLDNWYFGHLHRRCKCQRLADLQDLSATSQDSMAPEIGGTHMKHTAVQPLVLACHQLSNILGQISERRQGSVSPGQPPTAQQLIDTCQDYLWSQQNIGFHEKPHQNVTQPNTVPTRAIQLLMACLGRTLENRDWRNRRFLEVWNEDRKRPPFFQTRKSKTVTSEVLESWHRWSTFWKCSGSEPTEKVRSEVTGCPA